MSVSLILGDINMILNFVLQAFSSVINFINSNPILALSVYIPFSTLLIYTVFGLIGKLLRKNRSED